MMGACFHRFISCTVILCDGWQLLPQRFEHAAIVGHLKKQREVETQA